MGVNIYVCISVYDSTKYLKLDVRDNGRFHGAIECVKEGVIDMCDVFDVFDMYDVFDVFDVYDVFDVLDVLDVMMCLMCLMCLMETWDNGRFDGAIEGVKEDEIKEEGGDPPQANGAWPMRVRGGEVHPGEVPER